MGAPSGLCLLMPCIGQVLPKPQRLDDDSVAQPALILTDFVLQSSNSVRARHLDKDFRVKSKIFFQMLRPYIRQPMQGLSLNSVGS